MCGNTAMKSALWLLITLYPCVQAYRQVFHSTASIPLLKVEGQKSKRGVYSIRGIPTSPLAIHTSFLALRQRPGIASNKIRLHEQVIAPKKLGEYTRY